MTDYAKLFPDATPMDFVGDEAQVINQIAQRLMLTPEDVLQTIVDAEKETPKKPRKKS